MKTFKTIEKLIKYSNIPYKEIYKKAEKNFNVSYKKTDRGSVIARASRTINNRTNWIETEFYENTNCAEYTEYNY